MGSEVKEESAGRLLARLRWLNKTAEERAEQGRLLAEGRRKARAKRKTKKKPKRS
jgi:hypothetical protein